MGNNNRKTIKRTVKPGEDEEKLLAEACLMPELQAAGSLVDWLHVTPKPDLMALTAELANKSETVKSGDPSQAEEMLTAQAYTLNAIFHRLAGKAAHAEYVSHMEAYVKLAMRAQRQCALTWESISAIQNPPTTTFVGQANVAHNQQINNGSRAQETEKPPNQLLEQTDGNRLEFGATGAAGAVDSPMEALEAVNRTEDG